MDRKENVEITEGNEPQKTKREMLNDVLRDEIEGYDPEDEEGSSEMLMGYINRGKDSRKHMMDALNSDHRLAQVLADVAGKKRGAAAAFARYFGRDFLNAEEGTSEYDEIVKAEEERKKEMESMSASAKEYKSNIEASVPVIEEWAKGKGIDKDEFLDKVWERIVAPITNGTYSNELLDLLDKAISYDKDTKDAMDAGRVAGRNENIRSLRNEQLGDGMPSGITSQGPTNSNNKKKRGNSFLDLASRA